MRQTNTASDTVHAVVESRLRLDELRYTRSRRALVDLMIRADHPLSISEITHLLPQLPRSTAYRNLVDLQGAGLVQRVSANDEFSRFELAEELTEHHHHLLCVTCGRVIDVTVSAQFELMVAQMVDLLGDEHDFVAHDHRLDVLGHCRQCEH